MAAPSYTEDLTDIDLAEATGNYVALGGGGAGLSADIDFAIQTTNSITKQVSNDRKGIVFNNGSGITIPAGDHIYVWIYCTTPGLLDTLAVGGLCVTIGDDVAARNEFHIAGASEYAEGGWKCVPIKYVTTANGSHPYRTLVGTPAGDPQYFGVIVDTTATVRAVNTSVDAMRYGTGAYITAGEGGNPATFAGFAAQNDTASNRWGILTAIDGGYSLQGRFVVGQDNTQTPTAAYFDDSNTLVVLADTFHSETDFTQIIVDHASTTFNMTGVTVLALGTINPGRLVFNNASTTSALDTCTFSGIGITTLRAGVTASDCTWRGCDQITANAADMNGSTVDDYSGATDTSAVVWNDNVDPNGEMDDMTYIKGTNTTHAIEFGLSSPLTMTLTSVTFSGYNAANGQTDSTLHIKRTSGTVTINISGGTTPSYKTDGATVVIVSGAVNVTQKVTTTLGVNIQNARVILETADGTGPFPYEESVTITSVASVATVAHTAHGMATNDKVVIRGVTNDQEYNGVQTITKIDVDSYSYAIAGSPPSPAVGTIISSYVALAGLTDVDGEITMSRVFASDQPIKGRAAKSTSTPFYKDGPITGAIDDVNGYSGAVALVSDE